MVPALAGGEASFKVVGTFQNFNPTSTRQIVRVRGIANNGGYPLELVPGPADTSINVTYLALYLLPLNEALGYNIGSIVDLNRQRIPFDIQEICVFPYGAGIDIANVSQRMPYGTQRPGAIETNHYKSCFLSNIGRTLNQGTVTIAETATIQVTGMVPTRFPTGVQNYGEAGYNAPNVFAGGVLQ